ncbi:unnamed protein product [Protopolystoma xenopodis]|uniref:Uncharacterized protein n=1 Tax=Protopolystoma xenopodis TaxID=117903 RepID=A0A3S5FGP6_9PLAT|nr:unnamed protein product [Protopolystoma xenopodis]
MFPSSFRYETRPATASLSAAHTPGQTCSVTSSPVHSCPLSGSLQNRPTHQNHPIPQLARLSDNPRAKLAEREPVRHGDICLLHLSKAGQA